MTEKEYRESPAVSRSELWKINESPEKFRYEKSNPRESSEALRIGQALHKLVLQPENFPDDFAVAPEIDRRTKAGKAAYSEFTEKCGDKTIIDADNFKLISEMSEKLRADPYVKKLISGEREKPFFWVDEITGEACKCRADAVTKIGNIPVIADIKTAANADTETFLKHALKFGYHVQAAMYREGIFKNTGVKYDFIFIVIEKDPPYAINILQADELFIRYGYDTFRELLGVYHDCKITGNWYGYLGKFNEINLLGLPSYLAKEVE